MSYQPPDLQALRVAFTANATLTAHTLLATPAASTRYRVWMVRVSSHRQNSAGAYLDADLFTASAGSLFGFLHWAAFGGPGVTIEYPGGIALPWEEALEATVVATFEGQEVRANIYYTLEGR